MKKALIIVTAVISVIAAAVGIFFVCEKIRTGSIIRETGIYGNSLFIINTGTGSTGSKALYYMTDNEVLSESRSVSKWEGFRHKINYFGWEFAPMKAGDTVIYAEIYDCGDFSYAEKFSVSVSEELEISYTVTPIEKPVCFTPDDYLYARQTTETGLYAEKGSVRKYLSPEEFIGAISLLYGENRVISDFPDLTEFTKIWILYDTRIGKPTAELYLAPDGIYCINGGIRYLFVPDDMNVYTEFVRFIEEKL